MKRLVLLAALAVTAGFVALEVAGTLAGVSDAEEGGGSFTADLCADDPCKIIHAEGLENYRCNEAEWDLVITNVDTETAPRSIHVTWSEGDASVGLHSMRGHTAHYRTSSYLDQPVEDATARIHEDWNGRFHLGEGPCET